MDLEHFRWGALQLILLIISIGLHEFGHAWMADLRGDPLPRLQGRVTLNPFAHADPIGTIALPAIMIFLSPGFGLIGWGKPVQISLPNPKTRRMDDIYITLAGPAMNVLLCLVLALIGAIGRVETNHATYRGTVLAPDGSTTPSRRSSSSRLPTVSVSSTATPA